MERKRDLDTILDEIGYVGRAQIFYFTLLLLLLFHTSTQVLGYVFTAGDVNYRCHINECDNNITRAEYNPQWLKNAVPFDDDSGLPLKCSKYIFIGGNSSSSANVTCAASNFNTKVVERCDQFVFENDERTILHEFNLMCDENKWKLALPGTMQNAGLLVDLLLIGYISDRFGRKKVLIFSPILAGIVGIFEIHAGNFSTFVMLKFIESLLSGGLYSLSVVISIEFVSPRHRATVGTLIFLISAFGKVLLAFYAMLVQDWKILSYIGYIPLLGAVAYFWLIPESLKWLLVKGRYKDIADILLRIIKWNNAKVSPEVEQMLRNQPELMAENKPDDTENNQYPIWEVFNSRPMLCRIAMLSFIWITIVLVFYGLTLISVSIGGNKYTNFMIVTLVEAPAAILVILISYRVGRKQMLCPSLLLSGISLLIYPFVRDWYWIKVILFMIGKFAISVAFCTIYIFTSEMVPTSLRQTLLGVCSSFGRIGSIVAPQAPVLELVAKNLPIFLFGGTALAAGILSLQFPETLNVKLPNTIEEALAIGKKKSRQEISNSNSSSKEDIL